ncbi:hypothetical protein CRENBAI_002995 [Crenichthys baileyi]|uniref:Uncharacterized protein n=1 Tax=Crenichthys baileyi TaxID=28760 RepID=A0AAV9SMD8_9TELE
MNQWKRETEAPFSVQPADDEIGPVVGYFTLGQPTPRIHGCCPPCPVCQFHSTLTTDEEPLFAMLARGDLRPSRFGLCPMEWAAINGVPLDVNVNWYKNVMENIVFFLKENEMIFNHI